jgi:hypothetical protein
MERIKLRFWWNQSRIDHSFYLSLNTSDIWLNIFYAWHIYALHLLRTGAINSCNHSRYLSLNISDISFKIFDAWHMCATFIMNCSDSVIYEMCGRTDIHAITMTCSCYFVFRGLPRTLVASLSLIGSVRSHCRNSPLSAATIWRKRKLNSWPVQ